MSPVYWLISGWSIPLLLFAWIHLWWSLAIFLGVWTQVRNALISWTTSYNSSLINSYHYATFFHIFPLFLFGASYQVCQVCPSGLVCYTCLGYPGHLSILHFPVSFYNLTPTLPVPKATPKTFYHTPPVSTIFIVMPSAFFTIISQPFPKPFSISTIDSEKEIMGGGVMQ